MTDSLHSKGRLELRGVSKRYQLHFKRQLLAQHAIKRITRKSDEFWALRDVSFLIERGERVGVIGHNGAGKSTLLAIILGVTEPTEGEVTVDGKMGALLELGTGFHQDLTGAENVFLSGSLLGLGRKELKEKFQSIVEFSDLEKFIHEPVRTYSSGMVARLGFSVALHTEPDILALDEVLAVGDKDFQEKCMEQVAEFTSRNKTLLFVSHDLNAVSTLCRRAIWLEHGRVKMDGPSEEVVAAYNETEGSMLGSEILVG